MRDDERIFAGIEGDPSEAPAGGCVLIIDGLGIRQHRGDQTPTRLTNTSTMRSMDWIGMYSNLP